jgi:tetratricopeptide (TPR) repeat protein
MKQLLLLCLLSASGFAQDGAYYLKSTSVWLAYNRRPAGSPFFSAGGRGALLAKADAPANAVQTYRGRVFSSLADRNYEQAAVWLEKMAVSYPREHGFAGEMYLARFHDYNRALHHLQVYDAATATINDMIGNNPVSYLLGMTYRSLGNYPEAIRHFSFGIDSLERKHGPDWVNYRHYVSRAVSYIATGQAAKALADLDKAAHNYSKSALVAYHKGRALQQLNRLTEARTAFEDASFFYKALRAERTADYQEDEYNPLYEEEIENVLGQLKSKK